MRIAVSLFFMLAMFSTTSVAEEEDHKLPRKSWEKIDTGSLSPELFLSARDGYAVATHRELVESTRMHRAQSFTLTLYRIKIGEKKPEKLGQVVTTGDIGTLLGPKGVVAVAYRRHLGFDTIHIPGKPPVTLPEGIEYTPHAFTNEGLLCSAKSYDQSKRQHLHAVVLFPIDHDKGKLGQEKLLMMWCDVTGLNFDFDFFNAPVFHRGNYLVYAGKVLIPDQKGRYIRHQPVVEVCDVRSDRRVWRENGTLEATDDTHAYFFLKPHTIARRALDGKGKAEQMTLSEPFTEVHPDSVKLLDVHPNRILMFAYRDKKHGVSSFDLASGERIDYDLTTTENAYNTTFNYRQEPKHPIGLYISGTHLPLNFDGKTGELRVGCGGYLYKVPISKRVPAKKQPKWEPVAGTK